MTPPRPRIDAVEVAGVDQFGIAVQQFGDGQLVLEAHAT
jgi:hypothetical protein